MARESFIYNGYRVPAGWLVRNSAVTTHQMSDIFVNPQAFDPERFGPSREEDKKTPYALIGFGGGPRHCAGKLLAKVIIRTLVERAVSGSYMWEVESGQDLTCVLDRVFKPRSRLKLRFGRR